MTDTCFRFIYAAASGATYQWRSEMTVMQHATFWPCVDRLANKSSAPWNLK